MRTRRGRTTSLLLALVLAIGACASDDEAAPPGDVGNEADPGADEEGEGGEEGVDDVEVGGDPDGDIEFVYWNWGPDAQPLWERVTDAFTEENPDVTVSLAGVAGDNWGSYLQNVATMLAGGDEPDLIFTATEGMKFLVDNEILMPIDDLIEGDDEAQSIMDDMADDLVEAMRLDGQQYALPYAWNNMVMYYNEERFEEAGIDPPSEDWTWDEFIDIAAQLTEDTTGDGNPDRYGYTWDDAGFFPSAMPWVLNNGANMVSDDLCAATLTEPEVIEAVQFMQDLIHEHEVAPQPMEFGTIFSQFAQGDIAMFGAGRWPVGDLVPQGFESFGIQLYPTNTGEQVTEFGVNGFPILATSENPELAWEFAKFASSDVSQSELLFDGDDPSTDIPSLRSVAAELADLPPTNSELFYEAIDEGNAELVPAPEQFTEFEATVVRYLQLTWAGEMSAEEAMEQAQAELESVVSC